GHLRLDEYVPQRRAFRFADRVDEFLQVRAGVCVEPSDPPLQVEDAVADGLPLLEGQRGGFDEELVLSGDLLELVPKLAGAVPHVPDGAHAFGQHVQPGPTLLLRPLSKPPSCLPLALPAPRAFAQADLPAKFSLLLGDGAAVGPLRTCEVTAILALAFRCGFEAPGRDFG